MPSTADGQTAYHLSQMRPDSSTYKDQSQDLHYFIISRFARRSNNRLDYPEIDFRCNRWTHDEVMRVKYGVDSTIVHPRSILGRQISPSGAVWGMGTANFVKFET